MLTVVVLAVSVRLTTAVWAGNATFSDAMFTPLDPFPITATTGEKPQSKLWAHDDHWWSVMPNSSGTWLWRLDERTWSPVLQLATGSGFKADVLADGDLTHILLFDRQNSQLATLESTETGHYDFWSRRPGLVSVPLPQAETATITVDSRDRLWLASNHMQDRTIEVRYSDSVYTSFSDPVTLGTGITADDISAITAFPGGSVGVLWSDQNARRFFFREHVDTAPAEEWNPAETAAGSVALPYGSGMADDHLNFAMGRDGTLYAAVKTGYDTAGQTKIGLLVRRPEGDWDEMLYPVDSTGTRPIVLLDEAIDRLLVAYTASDSANSIVYRETALDNIEFSAAKALMAGALNNVTSTKQSGLRELVVMASTGTHAYSVMLTCPVPEPSSGTLLSCGAIGLVAVLVCRLASPRKVLYPCRVCRSERVVVGVAPRSTGGW
jgi:hypothetical protein